MVATLLDFSCHWRRAWSMDQDSAGLRVDQEKIDPLRISGDYRVFPEDFYVDENLGFELSGDGEHTIIHIEKKSQNTQWVLDELARQLQTDRALFGHCGLKDRHAVTRQWLSVQDPKSLLDVEKVDIPGVKILSCAKHRNKLRPGMHAENFFRLVLRNIRIDGAGDHKKEVLDSIETLLAKIMKKGFPNYFGDQRFGFDGGNLTKGWSLLESRRLSRHKKKSIYLSALRSFLFNKVLDSRVGDVSEDSIAHSGLDETGPLWGRGRTPISSAQRDYEQATLTGFEPLCHALEHSGLGQERRPLMVVPRELEWSWFEDNEADCLTLRFGLPPGSYATSLIRELGDFSDASNRAI